MVQKQRRCEWCRRAWRYSIIPCSRASRVQLRHMGKTTLDLVCRSEIVARPESYALKPRRRRNDKLVSGSQDCVGRPDESSDREENAVRAAQREQIERFGSHQLSSVVPDGGSHHCCPPEALGQPEALRCGSPAPSN